MTGVLEGKKVDAAGRRKDVSDEITKRDCFDGDCDCTAGIWKLSFVLGDYWDFHYRPFELYRTVGMEKQSQRLQGICQGLSQIS